MTQKKGQVGRTSKGGKEITKDNATSLADWKYLANHLYDKLIGRQYDSDKTDLYLEQQMRASAAKLDQKQTSLRKAQKDIDKLKTKIKRLEEARDASELMLLASESLSHMPKSAQGNRREG